MNDLQQTARQALSMLDLTRLEEGDTGEEVERFCERADTPYGHTAAVCVRSEFIAAARQALELRGLAGKVRIATVANFPDGGEQATAAAGEVTAGIERGADEMDVVFPYRAWLAGREAPCRELLAECRRACSDKVMKVILETGELHRPAAISSAAEAAVAGGADFLKTSTGMVAVNATPDAARILLEVIRDSGRNVGCKVSGGIRTTREAGRYLELAADIMGPDWVSPAHFRIGASGLLDDLIAVLKAG